MEQKVIPELSVNDQELFTTVGNITTIWPFPVTNSVRNPDSQALLDTKQKPAKIKPDLSDVPEGLF